MPRSMKQREMTISGKTEAEWEAQAAEARTARLLILSDYFFEEEENSVEGDKQLIEDTAQLLASMDVALIERLGFHITDDLVLFPEDIAALDKEGMISWQDNSVWEYVKRLWPAISPRISQVRNPELSINPDLEDNLALIIRRAGYERKPEIYKEVLDTLKIHAKQMHIRNYLRVRDLDAMAARILAIE